MGGADHPRADTEAPPHLSSGEMYRRAHRIEALTRIIKDCTASSSLCSDTGRAERLLKEIVAIAGSEEA